MVNNPFSKYVAQSSVILELPHSGIPEIDDNCVPQGNPYPQHFPLENEYVKTGLVMGVDNLPR